MARSAPTDVQTRLERLLDLEDIRETLRRYTGGWIVMATT